MASVWRYSVTLIDTHSHRTTVHYRGEFSGLSLTDEFGLAQTAAADLLTDLKAITDASVYSESLAYLIPGSEALPADADVTDELVMSLWLSDVGQLNKFATARVPAPIDAMFESDTITLDKTNANVIAYVANFNLPDNGFQVSDGEYVVTGRENGIVGGKWRSRAKPAGKITP